MTVALIATGYEATHRNWEYKIHRLRDTETFSIIRWPVGTVYIPPRGTIFTYDGWKPVIGYDQMAVFFMDIEDVHNVIENSY